MMSESNKFHFVFYLALLSVVGFLCTDMYLPAFDTMRIDLNTSKSYVSYSLTLFLAGFAIAQIFWGILADKKGNRKAILYGLLIFTIASTGIFFNNNIYILLLLRFIQAIGACAPAVCWQSLVIERYTTDKTNKIFSSIMPLVALSPALAPLLGVFVLKHFGWQYIFIILAILAAILTAYTYFLKDKTRKDKVHEEKRLNYRNFFTSRVYVGNVLIYGCCSAAFFAWLTGAPFFLKDLGYNETIIGLSFVPQTITFMLGGYGLRLLLEKIDGKKILPYLIVIFVLSLIAILVITIYTTPTLTSLLIPFSIMAFTNGATYPIVVNEAMKIFPDNAGKASGLQNTIQLGLCFLASAWVSFFSENALLVTAIVMMTTIPFVLLGYKMINRKV